MATCRGPDGAPVITVEEAAGNNDNHNASNNSLPTTDRSEVADGRLRENRKRLQTTRCSHDRGDATAATTVIILTDGCLIQPIIVGLLH